MPKTSVTGAFFFVKSFVRFVAVVAKTTNCDFANFAEMMWNSSFYQLKASFQIVSRPPTCQFALLHFSVKLSCHSSPCSGNFGHFTRKYLGLKLIIFLEFKLLQGLQTSFKKGFRKKPAQNHKRRKIRESSFILVKNLRVTFLSFEILRESGQFYVNFDEV